MPNSNHKVWIFISILMFILQNFVLQLCKNCETVSVKVASAVATSYFVPCSYYGKHCSHHLHDEQCGKKIWLTALSGGNSRSMLLCNWKTPWPCVGSRV